MIRQRKRNLKTTPKNRFLSMLVFSNEKEGISLNEAVSLNSLYVCPKLNVAMNNLTCRIC